MKVLVTGAAGFIGFHLCLGLLERGDEVTGLDNINDYYDPSLKIARLKQLGISGIIDGHLESSTSFPAFKFLKLGVEQKEELFSLFQEARFDAVIHLPPGCSRFRSQIHRRPDHK